MDLTKIIAAGVQAYFDRFNEADVDGIADLYAKDATVEDPFGTPPKVGQDAIREFYSGAVKSRSHLVQNGSTRIVGNCGAFAFTVHVGKLREKSKVTDVKMPIGKMQIDVIDVMEFDADGKIMSMKAYWGQTNIRQ